MPEVVLAAWITFLAVSSFFMKDIEMVEDIYESWTPRDQFAYKSQQFLMNSYKENGKINDEYITNIRAAENDLRRTRLEDFLLEDTFLVFGSKKGKFGGPVSSKKFVQEFFEVAKSIMNLKADDVSYQDVCSPQYRSDNHGMAKEYDLGSPTGEDTIWDFLAGLEDPTNRMIWANTLEQYFIRQGATKGIVGDLNTFKAFAFPMTGIPTEELEKSWNERDKLANILWLYGVLKPLLVGGTYDIMKPFVPPCAIGDLTAFVHETLTDPRLYGSLAPLLPTLVGSAWTEEMLYDENVSFQDLLKASESFTAVKFNVTFFKGDTADQMRQQFSFSSAYDIVRKIQIANEECGEFQFPSIETRQRKWNSLINGDAYVKLKESFKANPSNETLADEVAQSSLTIFSYYAFWYQMAIFYDCPTPSVETIKLAHSKRTKLENSVSELLSNVDKYEEVQLGTVLKTKIEDAIDKLAEVNGAAFMLGFFGCFLFGCLYVFCRSEDDWKTRILVFVLCFIVLCMCISATMGLTPNPISESNLQFLPFLLIGIGVDDIFMMFEFWHYPKRLEFVIGHATMTSISNVVAMCILYFLSSMPNIQYFCRAGSIGISIVYLNVFFAVHPIMQLLGPKEEPNHDEGASQRREDTCSSNKTLIKSCSILMIFGWVAMISISVCKIYGWGFELVPFGLPGAELIVKDENDPFYWGVKGVDQWILYPIDLAGGMKNSETVEDIYSNSSKWERFKESMKKIEEIDGISTTADIANFDATYDQPFSGLGPQQYKDPDKSESATLSEYVYHAIMVDLYAPENTVRSFAKVLSKVYDICYEYEDAGTWVTGLALQAFERFINVEYDIQMSVGIVWVSMFLLACFNLMDLAGVIIVMGMQLSGVCVIYASYAFIGLQLNNMIIFNLLLSNSFMLQFLFHFVYYWLEYDGHWKSKYGRAMESMQAMGGPVLASAMTTFIATIPTAFTDITYFRKYYFYPMAINTVIGIFAGFVVQTSIMMNIPDFIAPEMGGRPSLISETSEVQWTQTSA